MNKTTQNKRKSMKKLLIITVALVMATFSFAGFTVPELLVAKDITISGEFETHIDVTNSDSLTNALGYAGFQFTGTNWNFAIAHNLGAWDIEEANIRFGLFNVGMQPTLYGNTWPLHRPSENTLITTPRMQDVQTGILIGSRGFGIFYHDNDNYSWRIAPSFESLWFIQDLTIGYSDTNTDSTPYIIDSAFTLDVAGLSSTVMLEYTDSDISWVQASVEKSSMVVTIGEYNDNFLWGLGYHFGDGYLVYENGEDMKTVSLVVSF